MFGTWMARMSENIEHYKIVKIPSALRLELTMSPLVAAPRPTPTTKNEIH